MKRTWSILLALVMVLTLLPMSAQAAYTIPSASVTLAPLEIGELPDYTGTLPSGAHYYVSSIVWFAMPSGPYLEKNTDLVQAGQSYRAYVYLKADHGYEFSENLTAAINGHNVSVTVVYNEIRLIYDFPAPDPNISSVNITLDRPLIGAAPDYTAQFPAGVHYFSDEYNYGDLLNDILWIDDTEEAAVDKNSGVFLAGHQYTVNVYLTPWTDYNFTDGTTATLNGESAAASLAGGQLRVQYSFTEPEDPNIASVSVTLDQPQDGAAPDYTAAFPANAHYFSDEYNYGDFLNYIAWFDVTDNLAVPTTGGRFQGGHQYRVHVFLTPRDGYSFTENTTVTLNGQSAEASLQNQLLYFEYTFPTLPISINTAELTLDWPMIGAAPDYTAAFPAGAVWYTRSISEGNIVNDILWENVSLGSPVDPDSGEFQAGHQYRVTVYLTPQEGYAFKENTTVRVNGERAVGTKQNGRFEASYTFPVLEQDISAVSVTLKAPYAGEMPDYEAVLPGGAPYYSDLNADNGNYLNDIMWWDVTANAPVDKYEGVFEAGHQYRVTLYLTPRENYSFTENTTARVSGISAATSLYYYSKLQVECTFAAVEEPITDISIALDSPAFGAHPDCMPEFSAGVVLADDWGLDWRDETEGIYLDPDTDTFQAGHRYSVEIDVATQDGYCFTENTTATLNGAPAAADTGLFFWGLISVTYAFPPVSAAVPADIASVSAVASSDKITVSWPAAEGAATYRVARQVYGSGTWTMIASDVVGTSYADTSAVRGTSYRYRVRAYNGAGSGGAKDSAYVKIPTTVPADIASVTATVSGHNVTVSWPAALSAATYRVARQVYGSNSWTMVASDLTETSYVDMSVQTGMKVRYRVRAYNILGSGGAKDSAYVTVTPPKPADISSVSARASAGKITVAWPVADFAERYAVARQLSGSSSWTVLAENVTGNIYEDSGVEAGKTYRYRVRAYNAQGSGAAANSEYVTVPASKPGDIASVTAAASAGKITVSWPGAAYAERYAVARQLSGSSSWKSLATDVTGTSFEDSSVEAGKSYRYRVRAYNAQGSGAAADSAYVTVPASKPGDISSVTAAASAGKITVSWPAAANAARYVVARQLSGTSSWTVLAENVTGTGYEDSSVEAGKTYRYRVRAYNDAGSGAAANSEYVTVPAAKPGDIASVTAAASAGKITVSWPGAAYAERYAVARQLSGSSSWKSLATDVTGTSFEDSSVEAGKSYRYRVRAYNAQGSGAAADSAYVTVPAAKPGDIASVTAAAGVGKITVSWPAAAYAERYVVARQASGSSSWTVLAENVTDTGYEDSSAAAGTAYRYRIRAYNAAGSGAAANSGYATVPAAKPGDIASVTAAASAGKITVSWPAAANAARYVVARQGSGSSSWTALDSNVTGTSFEDTTADPGKSYRYRVRAYNALGSGAAADSAYVTAR